MARSPGEEGNRATALTVSELVIKLRGALESQVGQLWIRGEVSSLKVYGSGHWYFTLRDSDSSIRCVMWKTYTMKAKAQPPEGTEVYVLGRPQIWEDRGELRISVVVMLPTSGLGLQQLAREKVRAALERDGLLDPARKRALPEFPEVVAIVTSEDGAALQDMIHVARRRWPSVHLLVVAARVQGDEAPAALARAVTLVNRLERVDLCVIGRGGGAREDLAAFDDERVCRAVATLAVPSISAVGHETDTTLTDLVADVRAATPSAALELALPDRDACRRHVGVLGTRLARGLGRRTGVLGARLDRTGDRIQVAMTGRLARPRAELDRLAAQLEALSPLRVLGRGYSVARRSDGRVVRRTDQLPAGAPFTLRVSDGEVGARSEGRHEP
jgi:exodeoxyribonuclease VII large subunit